MFPIYDTCTEAGLHNLEPKVGSVIQRSQAGLICKISNGPALFLPDGRRGAQLPLHLLSGL